MLSKTLNFDCENIFKIPRESTKLKFVHDIHEILAITVGSAT